MTPQLTDGLDLRIPPQLTDGLDLSISPWSADGLDLSIAPQFADGLDLRKSPQFADEMDIQISLKFADGVDLRISSQFADECYLARVNYSWVHDTELWKIHIIKICKIFRFQSSAGGRLVYIYCIIGFLFASLWL